MPTRNLTIPLHDEVVVSVAVRNRIEQRIKEAGGQVIRFAKPTFAKAAPPNLRQEIATQCDAVIEALAD